MEPLEPLTLMDGTEGVTEMDGGVTRVLGADGSLTAMVGTDGETEIDGGVTLPLGASAGSLTAIVGIDGMFTLPPLSWEPLTLFGVS